MRFVFGTVTLRDKAGDVTTHRVFSWAAEHCLGRPVEQQYPLFSIDRDDCVHRGINDGGEPTLAFLQPSLSALAAGNVLGRATKLGYQTVTVANYFANSPNPMPATVCSP